ncbi:MAG: hypothetical protein Q9217_007077 [Psora testacea]
MLFNTIRYHLLALLLLLIQCVNAIDYGVGFSLSLDYGTASIYFSNGSIINLAKIEGGPSYKQMMRSTPDSFEIHLTTQGSSIPSSSPHSSTITTFSQAILKLPSLRTYLPPWLGGRPYTSHSLVLVPMLRALKISTESYLETTTPSFSLLAAEIVFPFPISAFHLSALQSASAYLSLPLPLSAQPPAGILAARAMGIGRDCAAADAVSASADEEKEDVGEAQLILTVDYTDAALTALLLVEECNVFEYRRVLHSTRLGAAVRTANDDDNNNDDNNGGFGGMGWRGKEAAIARAFRNITTLPLDDGGNGEEVRWIGHVILLGERGCDDRMIEVLRGVLREQYAATGTDIVSLTGLGNGCRDKDNVLFAAANGVARDCWDRLSYEEKEEHRI